MSQKSSKIEELYSNLSRQDKEGITEFLQCKIFNQSDILISLHLYLSEHLVDENEIDKQTLYRAIFDIKEKYSDVKLRVFMTKLTKLIEKYIVVKNIDLYPLAELKLLNDNFKKGHLRKNYTLFYNSKTEYEFESYEEYLQYEYLFALNKLDYYNSEFPNETVRIRNQFEEMHHTQQKLSFFQTLNTHCNFLNFNLKFKNDMDTTYQETIINELVEKMDKQDIVFQAYLLVYQLLKDPQEESFLRLKDIVMNHEISYEANYRGLLTHTQNFCIRFINSGLNQYLNHLFDIYNLGLKYYLKPGDLSSANFRNIVFCALQIDKIDWAESFVEKYRSKVTVEDQDNSYSFNYARIYFEKKEYKSAMRALLRVNYEDSFYASTARILLIKCYYELNEEMPLMSCCGSLTQFLSRNKDFTKSRVENNLHFIKFVKSLQNHRLKSNPQYFMGLKLKINESNVLEKSWLIKKVEEMI